jgi:hypothetical protein
VEYILVECILVQAVQQFFPKMDMISAYEPIIALMGI